jgi:hypothetical protein
MSIAEARRRNGHSRLSAGAKEGLPLSDVPLRECSEAIWEADDGYSILRKLAISFYPYTVFLITFLLKSVVMVPVSLIGRGLSKARNRSSR